MSRVIVIGGGIAGLASAALLARDGWSVCGLPAGEHEFVFSAERDDGGGVAEELLHVTLVLVGGLAVAHHLADAQRLDEVGDGAGGGVV
ncbi:MAG: hypothetical protein ABL886_08230, partial [Rhodoglobus sp.]